MNPFLRQLSPDLGYYHYIAGKEEFFFRRSRKIDYYGMNEQSGTDNYSGGIRQVPKSRTSSNGIELGPNLAAFRRSYCWWKLHSERQYDTILRVI